MFAWQKCWVIFVLHFCLIWAKCIRFALKMTVCLQLILLLILVPTTLRQGDNGRSPWQFGWWWWQFFIIWGIYATIAKKMADSLELIPSLTLVPTTLRQGDDGRSPWQFGWWWSRAKDHKNLSYWVLPVWDPGDKTSNQSNEKFLEQRQRPWNWFC